MKRCSHTPVDVEHADERVLFDGRVQRLVDVLHDPVEEFGVDVFGQSVSGVHGLHSGNRFDVRLRRRLQLLMAQPVSHVLIGHTQQITEHAQVPVIGLERGRGQRKSQSESKVQGEIMTSHLSTQSFLYVYCMARVCVCTHRYDAAVCIFVLHLNVAQVQDGRQDLEQPHLIRLVNA